MGLEHIQDCGMAVALLGWYSVSYLVSDLVSGLEVLVVSEVGLTAPNLRPG